MDTNVAVEDAGWTTCMVTSIESVVAGTPTLCSDGTRFDDWLQSSSDGFSWFSSVFLSYRVNVFCFRTTALIQVMEICEVHNTLSIPMCCHPFHCTKPQVWSCGLRRRPWLLWRWDRGFQSRLRHGYLSSFNHYRSLITPHQRRYSLATEKAS
jgi:hypothetical protein